MATDWHQGYLYTYQCIDNVFYGTLNPRNAGRLGGAAFGPFVQVAYRIVDSLDSELDQAQGQGDEEDNPIIQTFEVWLITIQGGGTNLAPGLYMPKPGDEFVGADGQPQNGLPGDVWTVKVVTGDPLMAVVNGRRVRATARLTCVKEL